MLQLQCLCEIIMAERTVLDQLSVTAVWIYHSFLSKVRLCALLIQKYAGEGRGGLRVWLPVLFECGRQQRYPFQSTKKQVKGIGVVPPGQPLMWTAQV